MNSEKQSTNLQMILREVNRVGEGKKNVPKLRFKGYEDAWEQRKLGALVQFVNGRAYKQEELLDVGKYKVVRVGNFNTNEKWYFSDLELETDKYMDNGDLLYLWATSFGPVIWQGEKAIFHYHIWKLKNFENLDKKYLYSFLEWDKNKISQNTNGSTMVHITKNMIEQRDIEYPTKSEQYRIGSLLESVDNLITLHQRKYDALKTMKKTLLSKMFPKDGEDVPEIRFKGFTDAWEQRKVSEITKFHKQGYYTTEEYNDNKKYYLLRGTDLTGNKLVLKDTPKIDASEKDYDAFKTEIGDFLIVRSGNVGTYGIVDIDIPAIFGSYLIDFRFDPEKVTNEFFGYFYQSERFQSQLNKITQSSANININAENIKSTYISLPVLTDQKKISNIMSTLDNCITLHQRKLEELKNMKKTLLQQMFV